jgi:hippurate hydrolase
MPLQCDADLHEDLVRLRHDLHRQPEIGLHLPRTQEKVLAALDPLPLEVTTGKGLSSVTAVLRGGIAGPSVLLRADMDALPLTETSGVPYTSQVDGAMHACGHDMHTTMLVGAARLLASARGSLHGDVTFMFQPGEEGLHGARHMIEEGVLEAAGGRPIAAYAVHVASALLPRGWFLSRRGPLLAAGDALHATVRGVGGHDSQPHRAKDPVPAACQMVLSLHTFATRNFDYLDPVLLSVGSIHAGSKANIIPAQAELKIGVRSFSEAARTRALDGIRNVLAGMASAHGVTVGIDHAMGYPVTQNDTREAEFAAHTVDEVFGPNRFLWAPNMLTASEDFSFVLNEIPGAILFLGACPEDRDLVAAAFNHNADAAFDDSVIADGAALLASLALRRLAAASDPDRIRS